MSENSAEEIFRILREEHEKRLEDGDYFTLDHRESALSSLELTAELLPRTRSDVAIWKWVILSTHDALFQAITGALAGHNTLNHLYKKGRQIMLKSWNNDGNHTETEFSKEQVKEISHVAGFAELWDRTKDSDMMHRAPITVTDTEDRRIKDLNSFRGDMLHPDVSVHLFITHGLPEMIDTAATICANLLTTHPSHCIHFKDSQRKRLEKALLVCQNFLKA